MNKRETRKKKRERKIREERFTDGQKESEAMTEIKKTERQDIFQIQLMLAVQHKYN